MSAIQLGRIEEGQARGLAISTVGLLRKAVNRALPARQMARSLVSDSRLVPDAAKSGLV